MRSSRVGKGEEMLRYPGATLVFAVLAVALAAAPAGAGTYYVALTGGGAPYDGTAWGHPFTNVQDALSAGTGNVIYVKAETFNLTNQLNWTNSYVSVRGGYAGVGEPGELSSTQTVLRGSGSARVMQVSGVTNGLLSRCTLTGGRVTGGSSGAGLYALQSNVLTIADCLFTNNYAYSGGELANSSYGGALYWENGTLVVTNCAFSDNTATRTGSWDTGYGGALAALGGVVYIFDSRFSGNWTMNSAYSDYGGAIYLSVNSALIRNCAIWDNNANNYGDGVHVAAGTVNIQLCDIVNNCGEGVRRGGGTVIVTNSILWNNGVDATGTLTVAYSDIQKAGGTSVTTNNCLSADPRFERGFYLATNSPCIDAGGDTAANLGMTNLTTRADGTKDSGIVDMGYHFTGGVNMAVADLYVAETGSDTTGDGAAGNPYRTIAKALSRQDDGTHIHIGAGNYTNGLETLPLVVSKQGVELLGTNATVTRIDGRGAQRVLRIAASYGVRVAGLSIVNGYVSGGYGAGVYASFSDVTIADCLFTNNGAYGVGDGISYGGALCSEKGTLVVTNCAFSGNRATRTGSWDTGYGGALAALGGGVVYIFDSRFSGNWTMNSAYSDYGGAIYLSVNSALIRNCAIWSNTAVCYGDGIYVAAGSVAVTNVTLAGNGGEGIRRGGGTVTLRNSILWTNGVDTTGTVTLSYCDVQTPGADATTNNCIAADPLFVNSAQGDYHEQSRGGAWREDLGQFVPNTLNSPCVDAGDPADDYSREPSPNGKRINMGAFGNTAYASKTAPKGTMIVIF